MAKFCPFCMRPSSGKYCAYCGKEINFQGNEPHLPVGTYLIGKETSYLLGAAIGQGGFGVTYAALDCAHGERVAIKEYFPIYWSDRSPNRKDVLPKKSCRETYQRGRDKFLDEAKTIQKVKYLKSAVNVRESFMANNTAYIVMDYLEGETLTQVIKRKGRLSIEELWNVLRPLLEDIDAMHYEKVIHRDIAPDNIIVTKNGKWMLIDFGNARSFQKTSEGKTRFIKPGFSPVEQYQQEGYQEAFTDVYAMAATIYYCLSGTTPAQSTDRLSEIANHHADPLQNLHELGVAIPDSAEKALQHAMAVSSAARTQTMREFCDQFYGDAETGIRLEFLPFNAAPDGKKLEVRWKGKRPPGTSFILSRRINGRKYHVIGKGNKRVQIDRIPDTAKSVQYRLELQNACGMIVGSCESALIDRLEPSLLRKLLLPMLAVLAAILLMALVIALKDFL